jgi:lysophospholipase L1-like esterase
MKRMIPLLIVGLLTATGASAATKPENWVATWAASPQASDPDDPLSKLDGQTVRERVRISVGGHRLRIRLSNEFGEAPFLIGAASLGLSSDPASVKPGSLRPLTFGGRTAVTIPAGAPLLSDPVDLDAPAGAELSISLYIPHAIGATSQHSLALKTAIISPPGDFTRKAHIDAQGKSDASTLVSEVLVPAARGQRLVVAFGDSITDGDASTPEADRSWPADLARRLASHGSNVAVVNEGIAGNRLLTDGLGASGLARFDRDVLARPGVTHVVLLEGLNDLSWPGATLQGQLLAAPVGGPTAEDVIAGYRQLIARAHAHRIKLIGATILPVEGAAIPGFYSQAKDEARQAVNRWIRTSSAFDGVIDFDAAVRDPEHPSRLQPRFASPDHIHPSDAGYQAMAAAVDLNVFR